MNNLDCHQFPVLVVGPDRLVNRAHASAIKFLNNAVNADITADERVFISVRNDVLADGDGH